MLGLATGSSPTQVYKWLVRWHREGALSFKHVITFNLVSLQPFQPPDSPTQQHALLILQPPSHSLSCTADFLRCSLRNL